MTTSSSDRRYLTRDSVRRVDVRAIDEFHIPGIVLMENAGRGAFECLKSRLRGGPVAIVCGRGNNGGDGYVIARHLDNAGYPVKVILCAEPDAVTGDAAVHLEVVRASRIPLIVAPAEKAAATVRDETADCEWLVDALLGTGTSGSLREPMPSIISAINSAEVRVMSVDLPSGMDCDTGEPLGDCVSADLTVTFVAEKVGFATDTGRRFCGDIEVVGIGAPRPLLESHNWIQC